MGRTKCERKPLKTKFRMVFIVLNEKKAKFIAYIYFDQIINVMHNCLFFFSVPYYHRRLPFFITCCKLYLTLVPCIVTLIIL